MENFILTSSNKEIEEKSKQLGYSNSLFLGSYFILIETSSQKELLNQVNEAKRKKLITIFKPSNEELLRFALEKTKVDQILGVEFIHERDSLHCLRGGLDQILCTLAAQQGKIIAFSFGEILRAKNRPKLLARMMFNLHLCRKYRVKTSWSTFASSKEEMRSAKDLGAFWQVLEKEN